jgi:hypothetical protein
MLMENRVIGSVKEALDELVVSKKVFYALRKRREIPRIPGHRFVTTRRYLWKWFESLIPGENEPECGDGVQETD